jgi:hypothetical protein
MCPILLAFNHAARIDFDCLVNPQLVTLDGLNDMQLISHLEGM